MRGGKQVPYLSPFQRDTVSRGGKKTEIVFLSENNKIIDAKKLAFHTSVKRTIKLENVRHAFFIVETEGQHTSNFRKQSL
jgi:hypothetical protein